MSTFSNSNISASSGPIVTKFYLNHHWGGGKAALGFGPDRIGTLVSMARDHGGKSKGTTCVVDRDVTAYMVVDRVLRFPTE